MNPSLHHFSLAVEREALDTLRRAQPHIDFPGYRPGTRRGHGPSLRERIHATLRGRGRRAATPRFA